MSTTGIWGRAAKHINKVRSAYEDTEISSDCGLCIINPVAKDYYPDFLEKKYIQGVYQSVGRNIFANNTMFFSS